MDLVPIIRELILVNECVILRGFGGFDTSYKDASYTENKNKLVPPSKKIIFHPEWIVDNGVLERYLIESLAISNEEAAKAIDDFVKELLIKLNEDSLIELEGIGIFSGKEGKITSFNTFEEENYLADSFGLDVLEIEEIHKVPLQNIPQKNIPVITKRSNKGKWWLAIGLLVILTITTLTLLFPNKIGFKFSDLIKSSKVPADTSEIVVFGAKNVLEDSVSRIISREIDQNTKTKNALQPAELKEEMPVETNKKVGQVDVVKLSYFYLVAGSFKNQKNAEALKEQLSEKGFYPEIISTSNNFYHVTIGKYDNMSSASEEKNKLRNQLEQSVWILEK